MSQRERCPLAILIINPDSESRASAIQISIDSEAVVYWNEAIGYYIRIRSTPYRVRLNVDGRRFTLRMTRRHALRLFRSEVSQQKEAQYYG